MRLNFIFSKPVLIIILLLSLCTVAVVMADTTYTTLNLIKDTIAGFFINSINAVKNGISNVVTAFKNLVASLIPDIPSLIDIKNYIFGFLPDWVQSWDVLKTKITDMLPDVPSMSEIWISMKTKIDDAIDAYVIDRVFEPMFGWVGYEWNYNYWIPWNVYYGISAAVEHFVNQIPGVEWLNNNIDKLKRLIP